MSICMNVSDAKEFSLMGVFVRFYEKISVINKVFKFLIGRNGSTLFTLECMKLDGSQI